MNKKYYLHKISLRDCYTVKEVAQLLNVHQRTVQSWKTEGLNSLTTSKPFLFMGYELKEFLARKIALTRIKLELDQFYCTRCRKAVRSKDNKISLKFTHKAIGKQGFEELVIKGICEVCSSRINRFSHTGKLEEIKTVFSVNEGAEHEQR